MAKFVIGIYIGNNGTTCAVILKEGKVVAEAKHHDPTMRDGLFGGVRNAIENAVDDLVAAKSTQSVTISGDDGCSPLTRKDVIADTIRINISLCLFVNALQQQKDLCTVGVIRLCGCTSQADLPPFVDFPYQVKQKIYGGYGLVDGGFECTKVEISAVNKDQITQKVEELWKDFGTRNFVVCGVFSPLDHSQECMASSLVKKAVPFEASVTESYHFSYYGLLERENTAILNECLKPLCSDVVAGLQQVLVDVGLADHCSLYFTKNDGTLMSAETTKGFPLLTVLSGPANAMTGAAFLSRVHEGAVVDVGEIETTVGLIKSGLPCMSTECFEIPGINVRVVFGHLIKKSIRLGSKSIVRRIGNVVTVGPDSACGHQEEEEASDVITAIDVAAAIGLIGTVSATAIIDCQTAYGAAMQIYKMIGETVDDIKTSSIDIAVLLVGEGCVILDADNWSYRGISSLKRTVHYDVAKAVGAAVGQISGESRVMIAVSQEPDINQLFEQCTIKAKYNAVANGANPNSLDVLEKSVDPGIGVYVKVIENPHKEGTPTMQANSASHQMKDNPNWPFKNAEVAKRDKECGLPEPTINTSGEWVLTASDIECLCIGAGVLGSGGGGSPFIGEVTAKNIIAEGKLIRVVNPCRLDATKQGVSVPIAFMGSPNVIREKIASGTETPSAFEGMTKLLSSGVFDVSNYFGMKSVGQVKIEESVKNPGVYEATGLENVDLNTSDIPLDKRITSVFPIETGGINSIQPLVLGAKFEIPVLDADGMGKAYPKIQMFTPYIYGCTNCSCCVSDNKGRIVAVTHCGCAAGLEDVLRDACCEMGYTCGLVGTPLLFSEILNKCVLHSLSKAWCIGRAAKRGEKLKQDPVESILDSVAGKLVIDGKVIEIKRVTEGGFDRGSIVIEGLGSFSGQSVQVEYDNENLVVHDMTESTSSITKEHVLACTPDIIAVLDSGKGKAIPNEEIKFGIKVAVIAIGANPLLLTEVALKVVGPRAMGFGFDYPFKRN